MEKNREEYENKLIKLTGENWCPYPSDLFIETITKVNDKIALKLILERRQYSFPMFLGGDPQGIECQKLLDKA